MEEKHTRARVTPAMASSTSSHDDAMAISATPNVNAVVVRHLTHTIDGLDRTNKTLERTLDVTNNHVVALDKDKNMLREMLSDTVAERKKGDDDVQKYRRDLDRAKDELTEERERRHQVQTQLQRVPEQIHKSIVSLDATPMVDLRRQCEFHNLHCAKRKRDMVIALLVNQVERAVKGSRVVSFKK